MSLGVMFGDVARSLFVRPATQCYPYERKSTPTRLRGKLQYDASKCVGCRACERDCPSQAIEIVVVDKSRKRYAMDYRLDRCAFCAQCVLSCRFGCLDMSSMAWELATESTADFVEHYGDR